MGSSVERKTQNNLWKKLLHKESNKNALTGLYVHLQIYLFRLWSFLSLFLQDLDKHIKNFSLTRSPEPKLDKIWFPMETTWIKRKFSLRSEYSMAYTDHLWGLTRFTAVTKCSAISIRIGGRKCKYLFICIFNKNNAKAPHFSCEV